MKKSALLFLLAVLGIATSSAQATYNLQQLKDSALQNNLAMRSARHDLEAARLQRKEAYTKYFPQVSATALWFNADKGMAKMDMNPSEIIPPEMGAMLAQTFPPEALAALANPVSMTMMKNGTIGSLTAVQPVYAGGQIVNGNKLAKVGEEASMLQMQLKEDEVEKNTEEYFWQIAALQEKANTIAAAQTLLGDIRKDVEVAIKAGVALRNDLLQVQLRQNDMASQQLKLQNGISLVRMLLSQYCGLRDTAFTIAYDADATIPLAVRKDHRQALAATTEYQLLGKQVEAAGLQQKMAVGKNMPSVAVGAGYNYHNLMETDRTFAMLFATVSIPISDWWGGSKAIKRSKIETQKAQEQLDDNAQLLLIRMQNAWNGVEEAYQQLSLAKQSIAQAEENLRLNRDFYKAGTSKMTDLLEAQLLMQQARDRHTEAFTQYQLKLMEYRLAVGQ